MLNMWAGTKTKTINLILCDVDNTTKAARVESNK